MSSTLPTALASDPYQRLKQLGQGSFGRVLLVRDTRDGLLYVLKEVDLQQFGSKGRKEAMKEVAFLKLLKHPNIIAYREFFERGPTQNGSGVPLPQVGLLTPLKRDPSSGAAAAPSSSPTSKDQWDTSNRRMLFICMEYANGGDLDTLIKSQRKLKQPFPEEKILEWFVQILLGLKHIHDRKILHRDIKAENIFIMNPQIPANNNLMNASMTTNTDSASEYGDSTTSPRSSALLDHDRDQQQPHQQRQVIKIGDFGISKHLSSTMAQAMTRIGTPYYLSPEISQGKSYNQKSDIWSAGICLYELCTLRHPFDSTSMEGLLKKIVKVQHASISTKYYSSELKALVDSLLQKDPKKRPTANELVRLPFLKKYIMNAPIDDEIRKEEFSHTLLHGYKPPSMTTGSLGVMKDVIIPVSQQVRRKANSVSPTPHTTHHQPQQQSLHPHPSVREVLAPSIHGIKPVQQRNNHQSKGAPSAAVAATKRTNENSPQHSQQQQPQLKKQLIGAKLPSSHHQASSSSSSSLGTSAGDFHHPNEDEDPLMQQRRQQYAEYQRDLLHAATTRSQGVLSRERMRSNSQQQQDEEMRYSRERGLRGDYEASNDSSSADIYERERMKEKEMLVAKYHQHQRHTAQQQHPHSHALHHPHPYSQQQPHPHSQHHSRQSSQSSVHSNVMQQYRTNAQDPREVYRALMEPHLLQNQQQSSRRPQQQHPQLGTQQQQQHRSNPSLLPPAGFTKPHQQHHQGGSSTSLSSLHHTPAATFDHSLDPSAVATHERELASIRANYQAEKEARRIARLIQQEQTRYHILPVGRDREKEMGEVVRVNDAAALQQQQKRMSQEGANMYALLGQQQSSPPTTQHQRIRHEQHGHGEYDDDQASSLLPHLKQHHQQHLQQHEEKSLHSYPAVQVPAAITSSSTADEDVEYEEDFDVEPAYSPANKQPHQNHHQQQHPSKQHQQQPQQQQQQPSPPPTQQVLQRPKGLPSVLPSSKQQQRGVSTGTSNSIASMGHSNGSASGSSVTKRKVGIPSKPRLTSQMPALQQVKGVR